MTPYELVAASLTELHRDFPRHATRSLQWTEDVTTELRALRAKRKRVGVLTLYNGGGKLLMMGGLDFLMEVIIMDGYCYTLLM